MFNTSVSSCRRYLHLAQSRIGHNVYPIARAYATAVSVEGTHVTATNRAEVTLKRFWKTVGIEEKADGFYVTLDRRMLKTPNGKPLIIPSTKRLAAMLIANEWDNQEKVLKPHALPVTSIASRAIDALREKRLAEDVQAALLKYLDTDTICFHQDSPETLVKLQKKHWDPLISWTEETFGVKICISESLFGSDQSKETKTRFTEVLGSLDEWQLAAMERTTYTTKSFLIALALVHGRIDAEQAAQAAHVEVNSQIEQWGEVEDSHDVDYQDIRRQLGSAVCFVS